MKSFYQIGEHLSLATVGQHAVVLDIRANRYFALPPTLSAELIQSTKRGLDLSRAKMIEQLRRLDLSVEEDLQGEAISTVEIVGATRRADFDLATRSPSLRDTILVHAVVVLSGIQLRSGAFAKALRIVVADASDRAASRDCDDINLTQCIAVFERVRRQVPLKRRCLIDSLALRRFLRSHQIASSLVIGVHMDPFAAHCWLQRGDLALNEDPDVIDRFAPIWTG